MRPEFWKGKKVLITGHTGFNGSWLTIWLNELGAEVIGYSLSPNNDEDNYILANLNEKIVDLRGDIRDMETLSKVFYEEQPEIVFHLAAQQREADDKNPAYVYESNVMGTLNVLECIRNTNSVKTAVMVTGDHCYEDKEQIWGYRESDRLGGKDPHSASKACAEMVISSYSHTFMNPTNYEEHKKAIASVRTGNVIGGGDWSRNRIIPDCVRKFELGDPMILQNPREIKPWQHVLEPTYGYLLLAEAMTMDPVGFCESWNFGPEYSSCLSVMDAAEKFRTEYRTGEILELEQTGDEHFGSPMVLDITKAKYKLGWKPKWNIDKSIKYTAEWYKNYKNGNVYDMCKSQIERYTLY